MAIPRELTHHTGMERVGLGPLHGVQGIHATPLPTRESEDAAQVIAATRNR